MRFRRSFPCLSRLAGAALACALWGWPGSAWAAKPVIEHTKPTARVGQSIVFKATISATPGVFEAELNWRPVGQPKFRPVPMARDGRTWSAKLPAFESPSELEYFLVAISEGTYERATWASDSAPERLRVTVAEAIRRKLSITSTPDRALVSIVADEAAAPVQGTTPLAVTLPPGGYTVTVTADGFVPQSLGIRLTADLPLDVRLQPAPTLVQTPPAPAPAPAPAPPTTVAAPIPVVVMPLPPAPEPVRERAPIAIAPPAEPITPPAAPVTPSKPNDDLARRMAANAKLATRDAAKGNASIAGVLGGGLLGVGAVLIVAGALTSAETSVGEQSRTVALITGISMAVVGTGACGYSAWSYGQVPPVEKPATDKPTTSVSPPVRSISIAGRF